MPLDEIHLSGRVPQFREKLELSLERFFRRLSVEKPVLRLNYAVQALEPSDDFQDHAFDPEQLGWLHTHLGPEELYDPDHHSRPRSAGSVPPELLRLRTERQTLRRLPLSGAIVFGIRTYLTHLEAIADEKTTGAPGRLASAIRSWTPDVQQYKGFDLYGEKLIEYLEQKQRTIETWTELGFPF